MTNRRVCVCVYMLPSCRRRNKHIMIDLGTGNNNKINWAMNDKQEFIDIVEVVYRGARKGRGLVVSPKDYSTKYRSVRDTHSHAHTHTHTHTCAPGCTHIWAWSMHMHACVVDSCVVCLHACSYLSMGVVSRPSLSRACCVFLHADSVHGVLRCWSCWCQSMCARVWVCWLLHGVCSIARMFLLTCAIVCVSVSLCRY